ncbi:hypothetical protein N5P37_006366 [Trichoderma harzianum]|nr:hypothetical protein N5P37_006366 [Trichoderma harzianum]PKK51180.1 hypothetical protein CI102_2802 [Trichoderma harzianum]
MAAPRYEIENVVTSIRKDDNDARFTVRRNGKVFYIKLSPSNFVNSPNMTNKYKAYLEVLNSGQEVLGEIYDTDFYNWAMAPFEPFFTNLAPDTPVETITLQPRLVPTEESPYWPSFIRFDDDFLDYLETWTSLYDPANIIISHKAPKDALFKAPKKVLIDKGQTVCFFKRCYGSIQITQELTTYKKIHEAGLGSSVNVCRLYGIVMDDCDFILGPLLTYIECGDRPLSARVHPEEPDDPTPANRIVCGDVKTANVLIDENENAWLVDFGGGYTEGWVDKEVAGTVVGDFTGMTRLRTLLFPAK